MSVSPGLQRKFDISAVERKKQINKTMKGIREEIHPEFYDAFEDFRKKFKKAMKTYSPANDNFLLDELNYLSDEVKRTNGEYNVRVGAAIIDQAESGDLGLAA